MRCKSMFVVLAAVAVCAPVAIAQQVSNPATLQWFESSWNTINRRSADVFRAGYGAVWTPPPGRAIYIPQGGGIGYDPYDRFDLGKARDSTLYGTEKQYVSAINSIHKFGGNVYVDYVHHHVGSLDLNLNGYTYPSSLTAQGTPYLNDRSDYPGFELSDPNNPVSSPYSRDTYAALYGANAGQVPFGDVYEYWFRLGENLVTINLASDRAFVRNPVPGEANNIRQAPTAWAIPTATLNAAGQVVADTKLRQANVASDDNRRFYPDLNLPARTVVDRGVTYLVHDFNLANPSAGDAVAETPLGYMQRYAQWMTQVVGVDGLRIDAARHVPLGVYNSAYNPNSLDVPKEIDRATAAGVSSRFNLDGTRKSVFNFQEIFNYDPNFLEGFVRKSQPAGDTVNPNRDVLDFSMWKAMAQNMTGNGTANDWFQIRSAGLNASVYNTLDANIANNGDNGIGFVYNHDEGISPPGTGGTIVLDNVAHAWVLMRPGNAYVYYRGNEFDRSNNPSFFLKQGRGDALGGQFGSILTNLVDLRNSYGRGNFSERWIDNSGNPSLKSAVYVFERAGSCLVGLNIGYNPGSTSRTVGSNFTPGQWLEEVTGNWQDPSGAVRHYAVVGAGGATTIDIPWNNSGNGNKGYVVYGLPRPRGTMSLSTTDTLNPIGLINPDAATPATNGTARISSIDVIRSDVFDVTMNTSAVTLSASGLGSFRDYWADGYRAMVKMDEGLDLNGTGQVDYRSSAASDATIYGFENFTTINDPGYDANTALSGNGTYKQTVNSSSLSEGYHYLTVRVWRSPRAGEAEVYQDFRRTIYVDRLAPESTLDSVGQMPYQTSSTVRDIRVKNTDGTADSVHVLFDVPVSLSDSQVLSLVSGGNKADMIDDALFGRTTSNVGSGLHTVVSVTYEPTGRWKVHRFANIPIGTSRGLGMGDMNYDGGYSQQDVNTFETALYSNTTTTTSSQFIASGDMNGNGITDTDDLFRLPSRYASVMNSAGYTEALAAIQRRGDFNGSGAANLADIDALIDGFNTTSWSFDLTADGRVGIADADRMILSVLNSQYGDLNLDHRVDIGDLDILAANFGQANKTWSSADMNGDNVVDLFDFFALAKNWGYGVPIADIRAASISLDGESYTLISQLPEPTSLLTVVGACLALRRRNSR